MSTVHGPHEGQPGYSPAQILPDGCGECARRGADVPLAIASMDAQNFARAWRRAADWNRAGLPDISETEAPLLQVLWSIQIQFENRGFPIGECPDNGVNELAAFLAASTSSETT